MLKFNLEMTSRKWFRIQSIKRVKITKARDRMLSNLNLIDERKNFIGSYFEFKKKHWKIKKKLTHR